MRRAHHLRPGESEPWRIGRDEEAADPLGAFAAIGGREDDVEVGDTRVGYESLGPVEHVAVAVAPGRGGDPPDIRPGARLGHGERGHHLSACDRAEPTILLRRRSAEDDRRGAEPLECEDRIGERGYFAQRLAHEAAAAEVEIEDRLEPPACAEQSHQGAGFPARRAIVGRLGAPGDLGGQLGGAPGERGVAGFEEGADQPRVRHASRTSRRAWCGTPRTPRGSSDAACTPPAPWPPTRSRQRDPGWPLR